MRSRTAVLAARLAMASPGAKAADLVVWWEKALSASPERSIGLMGQLGLDPLHSFGADPMCLDRAAQAAPG
jgi:hypothetical protein